MAIAYIALMSPGPRIATTAMASNRLGRASITSITRMMVVSSKPRKYPASKPSTTPSESEIVTEMSPISSDRRVPWIRRDSMSRPTGSVPSMKSAVPPSFHAGGASVKSRYCSFGGCGDTTSAKTASRMSTITSASPIRAPRLCEYACQNSRHALAPCVGALRSAIAASCMPDSRVDDAIEQIDDQIDADHDRRHQQDASLHARIVARLNAVDQPVADARPGKDGLGQDRAGQQQANLQPDHRDHRNECVAQRVNQHHAPVRQAFGAGGANVILPQHLEHRRARHPGDHREWNRAQRDRGQDEVRQRRAKGARLATAQGVDQHQSRRRRDVELDRDSSRHRRPAQLHREKENEH